MNFYTLFSWNPGFKVLQQ